MASETPLKFKEVSVEDVVAKAMAELKSVLAGEHDKVLAEKESDVIEAVKKQAETDVKLHRKLASLVTKGAERAELEAAMSTILSAEEIQSIKDTFQFETYQVEVYTCSIPGPKSFVTFSREGEKMFPDMTLVSSDQVMKASLIQTTSITIEIFMLILSAIGIKVSFNQRQMARVAQGVERIIQSSAFERAFNAFQRAWARGGVWARAKAIFTFLKDSYTAGLFWKIMKTVLSEMSTWEYIRAIASISAMIVAAFATGGAALIAEIALALDSAVTLVQKLINLEALGKIQVEQTD